MLWEEQPQNLVHARTEMGHLCCIGEPDSLLKICWTLQKTKATRKYPAKTCNPEFEYQLIQQVENEQVLFIMCGN